MNTEEIYYRLQYLHNALSNDSLQKEVGKAGNFTTGERIAINQERGYLYSLLSPEEFPLAEYKVLVGIEQKIKKSFD